jgi:hypothetical protein
MCIHVQSFNVNFHTAVSKVSTKDTPLAHTYGYMLHFIYQVGEKVYNILSK